MYVSERFPNKVAAWLDYLSCFLMSTWIDYGPSNLLSCFISTYSDEFHPNKKILDYALHAPLSVILSIILCPFGFFGILIWIILCSIYPQQKYTLAKFKEQPDLEKDVDDAVFTVVTANLLLASEFVNRMNNIKDSKYRTKQIASCILNHNGKHVCNVVDTLKKVGIKDKSHSILTEFPITDFLCLQEVWERSYSKVLRDELKEEFPYFVYDVGEFSWDVNHFMFGSGLMFASKKPILEADFKTFSFRTKHAKWASQGVLCVKVFLKYDNSGHRHVGYITNLHTQAYQEMDPVILSQLDEVMIFLHEFKNKNTTKTDIVQFDIVCGDFNADNMSPGDIDIQNHTLFNAYEDYCVKEPGLDHDWAIGTEIRQRALHLEMLSDPERFKVALVDDSWRRICVLDADVLVHNEELVTKMVFPDQDGNIPVKPYGGKRRIDRILSSKSNPVHVIGYGFVTALTNRTDHLPVCMSFVTTYNLSTVLLNNSNSSNSSTTTIPNDA